MKIIHIAKKNKSQLSQLSQLEMGIEIEKEKEHKDVYEQIKKMCGNKFTWTLEQFAENIAKAHIKEIPNYYDLLKKMENQ